MNRQLRVDLERLVNSNAGRGRSSLIAGVSIGGERSYFGFGPARARRRPRMIWHNGGTWGFRSFAGFVPARGVAVVVLANTARGVDRLGVQVTERAAAPVGNVAT